MGFFTSFLYQAQRSQWQERLSSGLRKRKRKAHSLSYSILKSSLMNTADPNLQRLQTRSYQCPVKYYQCFWQCFPWHTWGLFKSFSLLIVIPWPASTLRSFSPLDISNRRALRLKQMFILLDPKCIIMHFVLMNFFPFLLLQFSRTSNWKYKKELL